jgi:hypothetical protein
MTYRPSKIIVGVVALDEFDAQYEGQPQQFMGGPDGTAVERAIEWLRGLDATLNAATVVPETGPQAAE